MKKAGDLGLQIDDDPQQQRREWLVERVAWLALTALLLAIALGLFGRGGPLSQSIAKSADGSVQVEYDRFVRHHSPDALRVAFHASSGTASIRLDARYADRIEIEDITPQPEREIAEEGAVTYVFNTQPGTKVTATFRFSPEKYGPLEGWVAVSQGPRIPFAQFVFP